MTRRRCRCAEERGFALLMGLSVLVVLTILGLSVMSSVGEDLSVVRNTRESQSALAIAEAGIAWGLNELNEGPYRLEDTKQYDPLLEDAANAYVDVTDSDDIICRGLSDDQCLSWHEMENGINPRDFGGGPDVPISTAGEFRVAFGDDEDGDDDYTTDQNKTILLRSLGTDGRGSQRMIEVAISAGSP